MWLIVLGACKDKVAAPASERPFRLRGDDVVRLPYAVEGQGVEPGIFEIRDEGGGGSEGAVSLDVPVPFDVAGHTGRLEPGEARDFTVRFGGDGAAPGLYTGTLVVEVDNQRIEVELAAVVGDADLPDADWTTDAWGTRVTVALPSAPFPYGDAPWDDASVLLFFPPGLTDDAGVATVTHLHGHRAVLADVVAEQRLVEQHTLSGRDALLVVPQGPVDAADSDFGRLAEPGGYYALLRDAISLLYRDGHIQRPVLGDAVLTAHSGGYDATASMLDAGSVAVRAVHLFDALYGRSVLFEAFAAAGGTLRSSWTDGGGTDAENEALADELRAAGVPVSASFADADLDASAVTIGRVDAAHADCVTVERSYARWLTASGLGARPTVSAELRSVVSDGSQATVRWRPDPGGEVISWRVEGSDAGQRWNLLTTTTTDEATVPATAWIRVVRTDVTLGDSPPSDTYGGTGADWLVVDGFDRVFDGSWTEPTHTFAARLGNALGAPFSVASNEAVAAGEVDLAAFPHVLWMLGDEGVADRTFDAEERAAVEAYLQGGGALVVSGAEVGYATDADWLEDVLHASFVADDSGTTRVEDWYVGAEYPEDYPDVLDGDEVIWTWATGTAAAVGWSRQVVVVGFGLENLDEPAAALAELRDYL